MARGNSSVRMGPISLFALVIIICLAVMAVLALATARAGLARSERQADSVSALYANERAGQELVARVDALLAQAQKDGLDRGGATDLLADALPGLADAAASATAAADEDADADLLPQVDTASVDPADATATVRFATESGRLLDIELTVTADLTCETSSWKATTLWTEDTSDTVWSGPST